MTEVLIKKPQGTLLRAERVHCGQHIQDVYLALIAVSPAPIIVQPTLMMMVVRRG